MKKFLIVAIAIILVLIGLYYTLIFMNDESKFYGQWEFDYIEGNTAKTQILIFYEKGTCYVSGGQGLIGWNLSDGNILNFDPYLLFEDMGVAQYHFSVSYNFIDDYTLRIDNRTFFRTSSE